MDEPSSVGVEFNAINKSQNADQYIWKINDQEYSDKENFKHIFTESGRHLIELTALSGDKQSKIIKEIIIKPSTECMVFMATDLGNMIFTLYEDTPIHRDNFLALVNNGYYNSIAFHRIIDGFIVQAGDDKLRLDKKKFNFEEQIEKEFLRNKIHRRGALAAARMPDEMNPDKKSSGTQFYIVDGRSYTFDEIKSVESSKLFDYSKEQIEDYVKYGGSPQLDGEYTIFGQMIFGFETLEKIASVETDNRDKPLEDIRILEVKIIN